MMPRPRYKRTPSEPRAEDAGVVPVVLPHVVMTVAGDGTMHGLLTPD